MLIFLTCLNLLYYTLIKLINLNKNDVSVKVINICSIFENKKTALTSENATSSLIQLTIDPRINYFSLESQSH